MAPKPDGVTLSSFFIRLPLMEQALVPSYRSSAALTTPVHPFQGWFVIRLSVHHKSVFYQNGYTQDHRNNAI